jgi:hypothetical protein
VKFLVRDPKTIPTGQPRMAAGEPAVTIDAVQITAGGPYPEGIEEDTESSTGLSLTQAVSPGDYVVTNPDGSKYAVRKDTFEANHHMVPAPGGERYTQEEAAHLRGKHEPAQPHAKEEKTHKAKG